MNTEEKTKADGSPLTVIDLIYDKRYAEREHDSDYYDEDYYFSEEGSESSSEDDDDGEEEEEEYDEEIDDTQTEMSVS